MSGELGEFLLQALFGEADGFGTGRLPFKAIIHVAGINLLWMASERWIRGAVRHTMRIVDEHGFTSVAFPVIGAGSGSFNQRKALELMLDEFNAISSPADVRIVEYRR